MLGGIVLLFGLVKRFEKMGLSISKFSFCFGYMVFFLSWIYLDI